MVNKLRIILSVVVAVVLVLSVIAYGLYRRAIYEENIDNVYGANEEETCIDWSGIIEEETESQRVLNPDVTAYDGLVRAISFWGDSMTEGIGDEVGGVVNLNGLLYDVTGLASSDTVAYLTGLNVYNMGKIGETSDEIALREGGIAMYIDSDVVVYDSPVRVDIVDENGNAAYMENYNGYGCSSYMYERDIVYIEDQRYKVLSDEEGNTYIQKFYGLEDGNSYLQTEGSDLSLAAISAKFPVTITQGSVVKTAAAYEHSGDILVIEIGSNGGWEDYDDLIAQIDSMILTNNCDYYIIVGDTDDPGDSIAEWWETEYDAQGEPRGLLATEWENALAKAYGEHFLNTRLYLIENGLSDCGLEETLEDVEGYSYGKISSQLRYDWTHFNAYGYYSQALAIYKKGVELGYWQ